MYLILLQSCIEPFEPEGITVQSMFVVEGVITDEFKTHEILFSKTTSIDTSFFSPVTGARMQLIQDNSGSFPLSEIAPGKYITPPFQGVVGAVYQLEIVMNDGEVIQSSEVTLKPSPEIELLEATFINAENDDDRGIEIRLTSGEQENETLYARWTFEETYESISPLPYRFDWIGGNNVVELDLGESDSCYVTNQSNEVLIFSGLLQETQQVVNQQIRFLPEFSAELQNQYSIEVSQYAIDRDGFDYWQALRELNSNEESTFDIQPGRIIGNLTSSSGEPVLGFFDASEIKKRRIIFKTNDFFLDGIRRDIQRLVTCESTIEQVPFLEIGSYMQQFGERVNIIGTTTGAYLVGSKPCSDCRLFGTNVKPDFWP